MKYTVFLAITLFIFYSCSNSPQSAPVPATAPAAAGAVINTVKADLPIKDFIKKFKIVPFPFYYLGWARNEYYTSRSFELNFNSTDSLFYEKADGPVYGYAMLADTSKFYSLIFFGTADDIFPVLVTYSKTGKQLSRETLIVHGCGSDCGLKYCSYTAQINKDLGIYIADTVKYEGMCDSADNITPNSDSTFIYAKRGQVDKTGTIKLGEEATQRFKGIR